MCNYQCFILLCKQLTCMTTVKGTRELFRRSNVTCFLSLTVRVVMLHILITRNTESTKCYVFFSMNLLNEVQHFLWAIISGLFEILFVSLYSFSSNETTLPLKMIFFAHVPFISLSLSGNQYTIVTIDTMRTMRCCHLVVWGFINGGLAKFVGHFFLLCGSSIFKKSC